MAGGARMDPTFAAKLARRSELNHEAMIIFTAAVFALAGMVLLFDLTRHLGARRSSLARWLTPALFISLKIRNILLAKFPVLPSVGHLFIVTPYLGINIIAAIIKFDNNNMPLLSNVASRTGWMAIANTLIVVFLSLKNTPLAILTTWSYERLNIFHRLAGYTTVCFVIIHACSYAAVFGNQHFLNRLTAPREIFGIIAGFCFMIIGIAGAIIRRWWYELFYYLHVVFWMLGITMVGLHQPEPSKNILFVTCAAASIWIIDRLIRLCRFVANGTNNTVTVIPLPRGGTRLIFAKSPSGDALGKHEFIWIPTVRAFQTHPFTIVSTNPLEFVVSAKDGFTRALHEYATEHPGALLKCALDGPYGNLPNPDKYDKVILVAGGSGASFTVGAVLGMLRSFGDEKKSIVFIWIIDHQACLTWFSEHLSVLRDDPRISIQIFITRQSEIKVPDRKDSQSSESSPNSITSVDSENAKVARVIIPTLHSKTRTDQEKESSQSPVESPVSLSNIAEALPDISVMYHRPDVSSLIKAEIDSVRPGMNILVMGCGPQKLMTVVRNTAAENVRTDRPGIELYCEQFGW